jgi:hypothetical protein
MEIFPGDDPPFREIPAEEQEFVAKLCASHTSERLTPMELNAVAPLSQVWQTVSATIAHMISELRASREPLRNDALRRIQNSLKFDRSYLTWRAAQNEVQAAQDLECLDRIPLAIQSERIEVDSVYLVLGVRSQ